MMKPAFRAFLVCVIAAIALLCVSGNDATLAAERDHAISSSMARNGMYCIS